MKSAESGADDVIAWLQQSATRKLGMAELVTALCGKLLEADVPVDRLTIHLRQLHPLFLAQGYVWESETGEAHEVRRAHGVQYTEEYLKSPVRIAFEEGRTVRYPLENREAELPFDMLSGLRDRGFTEYVMVPLFFRDRTQACSVATTRPGGFSDRDIALMLAVCPTITQQLDLLLMEDTAMVLLDTFVGPRAGRKVLDGQIKRGDGQTIPAILWYCDLRGFTALSEELDRDEMIGVLNSYFQAMARPVEDAGGEILKFIGDAMLAIWPMPQRDHQISARADVAVATAEQAIANMAEANSARAERGSRPLRFAISLHLGDVMWGNIGAVNRLDFTVIGPAVNLVARLDDVAARLGQPLVVSEAFQTVSGRTFESLGSHRLKGIAEPQEVFRLAS